MLIGWLFGAPRLRIAALVMGSLAALAMVIVGCSSVTQGTAKVDAAEAPGIPGIGVGVDRGVGRLLERA